MSKKLTPQDITILRHLESGRSISPLEALGQHGVFRLAARIFSIKEHLRRVGDTRVIVKTTGSDVNGKPYARYSLVDKPADEGTLDMDELRQTKCVADEGMDLIRIPCAPSANPMATMIAPPRFPEVAYAA